MKKHWKPLMLLNRLTSLSLTLVIGMVLCLFPAWVGGVRFNTTPSMPLGVYHLKHAAARLGDAVTLCPPPPWGQLGKTRGYTGAGLCPDGSRHLLKRLVALESDLVEVTAQGIVINGVLQQSSALRPRDHKGREIHSTLSSGRVPPGMALVLAPVPWSFDGRYFGYVPLHELRLTRPVFTINPKENDHDQARH